MKLSSLLPRNTWLMFVSLLVLVMMALVSKHALSAEIFGKTAQAASVGTSNQLRPEATGLVSSIATSVSSAAQPQFPILDASVEQKVSVQLNQLGYTHDSLSAAGVAILPIDGPVTKRYALGGLLQVAGLAVQPDTSYPSCPDGKEVIFDHYRVLDKCSVVYNVNLLNSAAVLAHEIGHCLHFNHARYTQFDAEYRAVRKGIGDITDRPFEEIVADDFMICRYGIDTAWADGGYYERYEVTRPSDCAVLNQLFDTYFL